MIASWELWRKEIIIYHLSLVSISHTIKLRTTLWYKAWEVITKGVLGFSSLECLICKVQSKLRSHLTLKLMETLEMEIFNTIKTIKCLINLTQFINHSKDLMMCIILKLQQSSLINLIMKILLIAESVQVKHYNPNNSFINLLMQRILV